MAEQVIADRDVTSLWHYTSIDTLGRILTRDTPSAERPQGTLRLRHADYLNDPAERRMVYEAYRERMEAEGGLLREHFSSDLLTDVDAYYLAPFIASFSQDPDNLPLWTAYADWMTGIAIGFQSDCLRSLQVGDSAVELRKVEYGEGGPQRVAAAVLDELRGNFASSGNQITPGMMKWGRIVPTNMLERQASSFKPTGWKQEVEWRLVWSPGRPGPYTSPDDPAVVTDVTKAWRYDEKYRPYVESAFDPREAIVGIKLGPCADERHLRDVLRFHRLEDVFVDRSKTAYRC